MPVFACRYPAPGYREAGNNGRLGDLMAGGDGGCSWSSTVSGPNGVFLYFYTQNLYPSDVNRRGHGLQLRCLSE
ncbi:hypothetical protein [uncultured Rikenella sp.]|uniref:hypothetical protein n=1 Tax=uncultured Rikenella sp. TaxID=368003 RepID=UPI0025F9EDA1|nr:hypothetical protein [uncultured Rikenella sp.]